MSVCSVQCWRRLRFINHFHYVIRTLRTSTTLPQAAISESGLAFGSEAFVLSVVHFLDQTRSFTGIMATSGIHRNTSTRTARKIEAPRPLKDSSLNELNQSPSYSPLALSSYAIDCVEKLIALMDLVVNSINQYGDSNANIESTLLTSNIIHLCKHLKIYGPQLENSIYQGQLDRAYLSFREGMVRGLLEYEARLHLLDIVELRECNWIPRKNLAMVTNNDFGEYTDFMSSHQPISSSESPIGFGSDEVIKRSLKREKSSKSGSKSYCRNEVIIKNSDSGKVPPTAKERIVQITGPNEDKICYATRLIENTIRNNASPVRDFCGSESSCSSEESPFDSPGGNDFGSYSASCEKSKLVDQPYLYKHKVVVRNCQLTITGDDYTYVTVAKAILDDYFSKLRKSESPDNVCYSEDVFLDEGFKNNDDLKQSVSYDLNEVPRRRDFKSCTADFSDIPYLTSQTEDSFASVSSNLQNFPFNHQPDSALPSDITSLSAAEISTLTSTHGNARDDSIFPTNLSESVIVGPCAPRTNYSKEFLLLCKKSTLSQQKPKDWEMITCKFPQLSKEPERLSEVCLEEELY